MNGRPRYIPANSEEIKRTSEVNGKTFEIPAVVYISTSPQGHPVAIAYLGKQSKPAWNYRFQTEEQRSKKIDDLFTNIAYYESKKIERKQEKTDFTHGFIVDDILYTTWGYEQTNVSFFQVTGVSNKSIKIRPISDQLTQDGETGFMTGQAVAVVNDFTGPERTVIVKPPYDTAKESKGIVHTGLNSGDSNNRKLLSEWNGKPVNVSWYG